MMRKSRLDCLWFSSAVAVNFFSLGMFILGWGNRSSSQIFCLMRDFFGMTIPVSPYLLFNQHSAHDCGLVSNWT